MLPPNPSADERSLECMRLWTQHQPAVYAFIVALVRNWSDADDILQETAKTVWQDFAKFEPGTEFIRWARQIAWNRVQRWRKMRSRDKLVYSDEFLAAVAAAADGLDDRLQHRRRLLEACVGRLADSDRHLIEAYFSSNNKVQATAALLKRSAHSVSQSLYRIRAALFSCVERSLSREDQR